MSKQSKINQKSMSLLAVQGLDWCLRKAFFNHGNTFLECPF